METIAVFVNDAGYARHVVAPMLSATSPTRWILVACAPHLTRHAGRWVSKSARAQWHERWAAELCAQLEPELRAQPGHSVERVLARRPLTELTQRLASKWSGLRILDARQPRVGQAQEPLTAEQSPATPNGWVAPLALTTSLSAMLALAD